MTHFNLNDLQIPIPDGWSLNNSSDAMATFMYEQDDYIFHVQLFDVGEKTVNQLMSILYGIKIDDTKEYYGKGKYTSINPQHQISEVRLKGSPATNSEGISFRHYLGYFHNLLGGNSFQSLSVLVYPEKKSGKLPLMHKTLTDFLGGLHYPAKPVQPSDNVSLYKSKLGNTKFSYYESYNSGYGGGGYGTLWEIFLYNDNSFRYKYESYTSVSMQGISLGGGSKSENGAGEWRLSKEPYSEKVYLSLLFSDGRRKSYLIALDSGKVWLNDTQMHWSRM